LRFMHVTLNLNKMLSPQLLEEFGDCFIASFEIGLYRIGILEEGKFDKKRLLDNPFDALLFFTQYAHERMGGGNFSKYHRIALHRALNKGNFAFVVLNDGKFPDRVWEEFKKLTNGKPNEKCTRGAVKDILIKLREEKEANIICLLGKHSLEDASKFLRRLKGIGPKISALFLRDLQEHYDLWNPNESNYHLLQPVDRWVRRMARECWPRFIPSGNHDKDAKEITKLCLQNNINPIRFNMGAWFIGSHYDELCRFHNIPEELTPNWSYCIEKFDKEKVSKALKKYLIEFRRGNILYF